MLEKIFYKINTSGTYMLLMSLKKINLLLFGTKKNYMDINFKINTYLNLNTYICSNYEIIINKKCVKINKILKKS